MTDLQPKRLEDYKPWQFRLRTLMLIMLAAAVGLGWWKYAEMRNAEQLRYINSDVPKRLLRASQLRLHFEGGTVARQVFTITDRERIRELAGTFRASSVRPNPGPLSCGFTVSIQSGDDKILTIPGDSTDAVFYTPAGEFKHSVFVKVDPGFVAIFNKFLGVSNLSEVAYPEEESSRSATNPTRSR